MNIIDLKLIDAYTVLILAEKKTINDVPEKIKADVQAALIEMGHPELAEGDD